MCKAFAREKEGEDNAIRLEVTKPSLPVGS